MEKRSLRQRLCASLDIAPDVLPHGSLVQIRDRGYVEVSGCGKILRYTREEICVTLHRGVLIVRGEGLLCSSFCKGELGIEGNIFCVSFEERYETV